MYNYARDYYPIAVDPYCEKYDEDSDGNIVENFPLIDHEIVDKETFLHRIARINGKTSFTRKRYRRNLTVRICNRPPISEFQCLKFRQDIL